MTRRRPSHLVSLAVLALAAGLPTVAAAAAAPAAAATTTYTITDLGSLGYGVSRGLAINANGQVTGYSYLSMIPITCPPYYKQQKRSA